MANRKFYKEIDKAYNEKNRAIVVTITDLIGKSEAKNRIGNKIILKENKNSYIASEKNSNNNNFLQTVINSLSEKKGNKLFTSNKPSQKIIAISKNLEAEVYIDPLIQKPRLVIFGAGHIARPLAKMGEIIGFKILVMDDREDMVNKTRFPEADCLICRKFEDFLSDLKIYTNDYLVIVTRGHQHDYLVLRKVIDSRAKYIGMVGSSNRVNIIFERLQKVEGVKEEYIKRVQAPIGIPIASETPEEIAVSIIAQLIATRRKEGYNG